MTFRTRQVRINVLFRFVSIDLIPITSIDHQDDVVDLIIDIFSINLHKFVILPLTPHIYWKFR